jgi:hypothetical protein
MKNNLNSISRIVFIVAVIAAGLAIFERLAYAMGYTFLRGTISGGRLLEISAILVIFVIACCCARSATYCAPSVRSTRSRAEGCTPECSLSARAQDRVRLRYDPTMTRLSIRPCKTATQSGRGRFRHRVQRTAPGVALRRGDSGYPCPAGSLRVRTGARTRVRRGIAGNRAARDLAARPRESLAGGRPDAFGGLDVAIPDAARGFGHWKGTVSGLEYDGRTGELRYAGDGARDLSVRLERTDAPIASNTFRIRVLTPTHVYGEGAATANREHRWGAKVCEPPMTFAACRKGFKGAGMGDASPLVVHFTPGSYEGDFFLGKQRFVYVLGDPQNWPQLNRDSLDVSRFRAGVVSQPRAQFDADRAARSAR